MRTLEQPPSSLGSKTFFSQYSMWVRTTRLSAASDAGKPELVEGFTRKTFTAMVEGIRGPAIEAGMVDPATFDQGIADLYRTTGSDGTFCYTFFKALGVC